MRRLVPALIALLAIACLPGCWLTERVDPAELDRAAQIVQTMEARAAEAEVFLADAKRLAEDLDQQRAAELIAKAEHYVAITSDAASEAREQFDELQQLAEDGVPWWSLILNGALGIGTVVLGAIGGKWSSIGVQIIRGVQAFRDSRPANDEARKALEGLLEKATSDGAKRSIKRTKAKKGIG